uniref:Nudix hydrolase domain-containing protein n=1 Tax=Chromera velia CCMP2878 TaxID=1169474 RepID=A0A0G4I9B9_9ALVE|eukprot:Cvel_12105.t1-p1 / transcript=Cvel_12105.t1 / gene=Cvel_12105 / organism=Chromera_velia_CCMP2878 / gene_product=hypothetical protein / transcript_product=hypothetical protein / location=Cvel_scaffold780:2243-3676(+) / protein_length=478 / sequence_SO=supercontig / SO=protein_coding / is_pseudo=false
MISQPSEGNLQDLVKQNERVPASGLILVDPQGPSILLILQKQRWRREPSWNIPGGLRDRGETSWEAALREFSEEVGQSAQIERHLETIRKNRFDYHVAVGSCKAGKRTSEALTSRWFPFEEIRKMATDSGVAFRCNPTREVLLNVVDRWEGGGYERTGREEAEMNAGKEKRGEKGSSSREIKGARGSLSRCWALWWWVWDVFLCGLVSFFCWVVPVTVNVSIGVLVWALIELCFVGLEVGRVIVRLLLWVLGLGGCVVVGIGKRLMRLVFVGDNVRAVGEGNSIGLGRKDGEVVRGGGRQEWRARRGGLHVGGGRQKEEESQKRSREVTDDAKARDDEKRKRVERKGEAKARDDEKRKRVERKGEAKARDDEKSKRVEGKGRGRSSALVSTEGDVEGSPVGLSARVTSVEGRRKREQKTPRAVREEEREKELYPASEVMRKSRGCGKRQGGVGRREGLRGGGDGEGRRGKPAKDAGRP